MRPGAVKAAATLGLAALALAACSDQGRGSRTVAGLCQPFAGADGSTPALAAGDPAAGVDDCLHRWGYALAGSTDDAGVVADAVVAACSSNLTRWNQQALAPAALDPGQAAVETPQEAPSLLTGETTTPVAGRYAYAQGRALFYVVQARAGHCAAPAMSRGTFQTKAAG